MKDVFRHFISELIFIFLIIILAVSVFAVYQRIENGKQRREAEQSMDARELHYDANSWFILIDKSEGLIGIYDGTKPVQYIWVDVSIDEGVFPVLIYGDSER